MDDKLQQAIDLIEEAGGIVLMQSTEETEMMAREAAMLEKTAEEQIREAESKKDYEERKANAFEEFEEELGSPGFCFNGVDDLCYRNGIDLDDIEEYIFSHY